MIERGRQRLRFRPGETITDLRGARWDLEGSNDTLEAAVADGRLRSEQYPDPLARVFAALTAPHAGDLIVSLAPGYEALDWGGTSHAGGGSHGSLHRDDSLGPLAVLRLWPRGSRRARAVDAARRGARRALAFRAVRREVGP